jgi:arylsulfatase A-like enzyme
MLSVSCQRSFLVRLARCVRGVPPVLACLPALLSAACSEPEAGPPASLVIVSLDTTRADRLGAYGAERPTTPHLDALAEHALLFETARAPAFNTLVSHASLFTGLFPRAHGATPVGEARRLPSAARTLAEDLSAAGWQTAAFTTHADWLSAGFGMDQGFEHFDASWDGAPAVLERARAWLERRDRTRPFLLFVHLFDVHSDDDTGRPYRAPDAVRGRFTGRYPDRMRDWQSEPVRGSIFLEGVRRGRIDLLDGEIDELRAQYDEGLLGLDRDLGPFLEQLRAGQAPEAWLCVTADHGEEFLEHGGLLHVGVYEEILRVPWLLVPPAATADAWGTPRRLPEPVSLVDVRPTLLGLVGVEPGSASHGRNLAPWLRGEAEMPAPMGFPVGTRGLILDEMKLLRRQGGAWELYDLETDPAEQHDLAGTPEGDALVASLLAELERLDGAHTELAESLHAAEEETGVALDPDALRRLEELGYTR